MSEFDFDELDRAVNGAINNSPAKKSITPVAIAPEPVEESFVEEVVERAPVVELNPVESPVEDAIAPAARRSSGRFMDMVHPSSDMRAKASGETVIKPVVAPVEAAATVAPWQEAPESPFLPDAKVEKRPLGGSGPVEEPKEELLEAPEPQELLEEHVMPDPIDFAAASAVINEEVEEPVEVETPEVQEEAPLESPVETLTKESTPESAPFEESIVTEEEPVGPTSITQQYKEQPSSNQESGAIYDTENYHQPVVQPVKKKSGMLTLIWILLLVVLGAGAGWAVYTYVLPML